MNMDRWNISSRMVFRPDDGTGSGSASSGAGDSSGGGVGGGSSVSSPAPDGGGSPPSAPSPDSGSPAAPLENWEALGSVEDLDSFTLPDVAPAPVVPPVAPVVPPAPVAATPPLDPAAAPVPPVVSQPQPQPAPQSPSAAPLSPSEPLGIAAALEANRDAAIAHLAETRFALTPDDVAELEDNAAAFVPKMMARVLHESQVSMMKFLAQSVPGMVKQFNTVSKANNDAETQFFIAHKALGLDPANQQHRQAAFRMASLYRQSNPDMPMAQLMAEVGPIVAASLKLPLVPGQAVPGQTITPVMPRAAAPFRPAVNGGGGAPPTPEPENEWAGMGQTYD